MDLSSPSLAQLVCCCSDDLRLDLETLVYDFTSRCRCVNERKKIAQRQIDFDWKRVPWELVDRKTSDRALKQKQMFDQVCSENI